MAACSPVEPFASSALPCLSSDTAETRERLEGSAIGSKDTGYREDGAWQAVARSSYFNTGSYVVTAIFLVWLAIFVDFGSAETLLKEGVALQVPAWLFLLYFLMDWITRLMAFRTPMVAFRNVHMVTDMLLLILFVLANVAIKKLMLLQLIRVLFMFDKLPEGHIVIKGLCTAMRSIFFCVLLHLAVTYAFGVAVTSLAAATVLKERSFPDVSKSMFRLFLHGALLQDLGNLLEDMAEVDAGLVVLVTVYALLSLFILAITLGVLCQVVSVVAEAEKEQLTVAYLEQHLQDVFRELFGPKQHISKAEYLKLLEHPKLSQRLGMDALALVDVTDAIFTSSGSMFSLKDFPQLVYRLCLGGSLSAKDIVKLDKLKQGTDAGMQARLANIEDLLQKALEHKNA